MSSDVVQDGVFVSFVLTFVVMDLLTLPEIIDLVDELSEHSEDDMPSSSVAHNQTLQYINFNPCKERV